jgi:hypothetical protein
MTITCNLKKKEIKEKKIVKIKMKNKNACASALIKSFSRVNMHCDVK